MKRFLFGGSVLLFILWLFVQKPGFFSFETSFFQWRYALIILSGTLALFWMATVTALATRPAWLEQRIGGLDRLYAWHKWTGILGTLAALCHWLFEKSPQFWAPLVQLGARHGRPPHGQGDLSFLKPMAAHMGELAFYAMVILVIMALFRWVPYRIFRLMHKAFPVVFLFAAFHSVVLLPRSAYTQPLGWAVLLMAIWGSVAALLCLTGRIGRRKRHVSKVSDLQVFGNGTIALEIVRPSGWEPFRSGQFALLDFGHGDGFHPFSVVEASTTKLGFAIKPLGDYTRTLANRLRLGDALTVEGPYGGFVFDENEAAQVWVAGGIGIAPFLARLEELAARGKKVEHIDLFYSLHAPSEEVLSSRIEELCGQVGVRLHKRISSLEGRFRSEEIHAVVRDKGARVWFCGAADWAPSLKRFLVAQGLAARHFHQELFEFR